MATYCASGAIFYSIILEARLKVFLSDNVLSVFVAKLAHSGVVVLLPENFLPYAIHAWYLEQDTVVK